MLIFPPFTVTGQTRGAPIINAVGSGKFMRAVGYGGGCNRIMVSEAEGYGKGDKFCFVLAPVGLLSSA